MVFWNRNGKFYVLYFIRLISTYGVLKFADVTTKVAVDRLISTYGVLKYACLDML